MRLRGYWASVGARDRRALRVGSWAVLLLLAAVIARPYVAAIGERREALDSERDALTRERRAVSELPRDSALMRSARAQFFAMSPRLFSGVDLVTASAELARYVSTCATENGLRLEQAESEARIDSGGIHTPAVSDATWARADRELRVGIRARGDVLAIYAFLRALEDGPKLVRVERIAIVHASTDDAFDGILTLTATVAGLARGQVVASSAQAMSEDEP